MFSDGVKWFSFLFCEYNIFLFEKFSICDTKYIKEYMVWESSNYNYIRFHEIRIFNVGLCGNIGEEFFFGMPTKALEIQKA